MISRAKPSLILVGLLLVLLPVLAVLQYVWIGEVSAAERDRLTSSLHVSSERFATDFDAEFSRISNAFQIRDGVPENSEPFIERYQLWMESSAYSRLVHGIYLLKNTPDSGPAFYKIDLNGGLLQPATLPNELEIIRERMRRGAFAYSADNEMRLLLVTPLFRPGRNFGGPRPDEFRPRGPEDFRRRGDGPRGGERVGPERDRGPRPDRGSGPDRGPGPNPGPPGPGGPADGAVVIELDSDAILKDLVPALVERHFSSHDQTAYRVAIATPGNQPRILYSSAGQWTAEDIAQPDEAVQLFNLPRPNGFGGRGRGQGPRPAFQASPFTEGWKLVVKHRAGSLENAVEQLRNRNLAISFGILLVLGAGLISLVVSSQRAHTLGKLQMEFAAGVSHELRTPLAVIRSAAHNLRSGIVRDKEGVEEYAAIVQEEARRLSDMVEEVLLYAETQSSRRKYSVEPIDVTEVIDRAITNLSPTIDPEHCEVITRIDPDLPPVKADAAALTQCVQNLLSNAIKYGTTGDKTEIELDASKDPNAKEIRLTVTDHGQGIEAADHRQLFEPFYRGRNVGSNVPGNGLGLHLVQRMMQAQGGRVTFTAAAHGGASFTLHIPAES